jgi:hypothetical protein
VPIPSGNSGCINEVIIWQPDLILIDESEVEGITTFVFTDWRFSHPKDEKFLKHFQEIWKYKK